MLIPSCCNLAVILAGALALVACGRPPTILSVDPDVSFGAHLGRDGIVMDRLPGGGSGALEPPGWLRAPGSPDWVLRNEEKTLAGLWQVGASRILARTEASTISPLAGQVLGDWDDGAVRLTLHLPDGASLRSNSFAREGGGTGPSRLSRSAQTVLDVRGTYRAPLHDARGDVVGWLRIRVSPYQGAPRRYDGVLPEQVGPGLAAAAVLALDTEITWIEDHAIDVYRGAGSDRLEDSIGR